MPDGVLVSAVLLFVLFVLLQIVHVVPLGHGVLLEILGESVDVPFDFVSGVGFLLSLTALFPSVLSSPIVC